MKHFHLFTFFVTVLLSGDAMPSANIATFDTADYTYLIGMDRVNWTTAWELCPLYGDGFYLDNVDGTGELDLLRPWLESFQTNVDHSFIASLELHFKDVLCKPVIVLCAQLTYPFI